jgi:HEAT repeat protein
VDRLLESTCAEKGEKALGDISALPDDEKTKVAAFLVERLAVEKASWKRCWSISGLAAINRPDTAKAVADHIDPVKEPYEWARYWAVVAIAKMAPPNVADLLAKARKDDRPLVKAAALRLLVDSGDDDCADELLDMARDQQEWQTRHAACKVLRRRRGLQPLSEILERKVFSVLEYVLNNPAEWMEVQFQAAQALGDLEHRRLDAIKALGRALEENHEDWVRRACVGALKQINTPETKAALLYALKDGDAEIRVRAAQALSQVLGAADAVGYIVEHLLQEKTPPREYLSALRGIDGEKAAAILSDHLLHPDPDIAARAGRALAELGGEAAVRTLQAQRTKALDTYTKLLGDADKQIMTQFDLLMSRARYAFSMSMVMHAVIFSVGVLMLGVGLYFALYGGFETFQRYIGAGAAATSLGTLLALFYRDPLKNIRQSVTRLMQVNVIFLGYMRQINQTDATFKQLFLVSSGFGVAQMRETVTQIQESVTKTMDQVKAHLGND